MDKIEKAKQIILERLPDVRAIYLFGSFGTDYERKDSDIDIAVLARKPFDAMTRWNVGQDIAVAVNQDVDLIDFLSIVTDFQYEIIMSGRRIYCKDEFDVDLYENFIMSEHIQFMERRQSIVDDIVKRGRVRGR